MIKKRFTCDNDYYKGLILKDNLTNEILEEDGIGGYDNACNKLNELADENEQLRIEKDTIQKQHSYELTKKLQYKSKLIDLKKENEQLKQFKEDVFAKIDMHLRMLPTARDNEFNEYDGDPSLYTGAIYILETLKKELKE